MHNRTSLSIALVFVVVVLGVRAAANPRPAPRDPLALPSAVLDRKAGAYELYTSDGYALVNLRGGAPALLPIGGPSTAKKRTISGRVIDRAGAPVAGAIVFADRGVSIRLDTVMALAATTTDASGAFTLHDAPADECFAIALAGDDWSALAPVGDGPVELRMRGHGALAAQLTYDGLPETFALHLGTRDKRFGLRYVTGRDGTLTIPSLPPGTYIATAGLAHGFDGVSHTMRREITIADGQTAKLDLSFARGANVVVTARPPAGEVPNAITYWLFAGAVPKDAADARARGRRESPPSMTVGGTAKRDPVELHDVAPGRYWACAAFFDVTTMDALDRPFGCTAVSVPDDDSVRQVEVVLAR